MQNNDKQHCQTLDFTRNYCLRRSPEKRLQGFALSKAEPAAQVSLLSSAAAIVWRDASRTHGGDVRGCLSGVPGLPVVRRWQFHADQFTVAAGVNAATGVGGVRPGRAEDVGPR